MIRRPPRATRTDTLFPYTTLFRSIGRQHIMTLRVKSDVTMQERLKDFDPDGALRQHAREIFELLKEDIHHRSEEHTSELQSLMRISYAVFCLKKKKNESTQNNKKA